MGKTSARQDLSGIYIALKNIKPSIGIIVTNLMFLLKSTDPNGFNKTEGLNETCARLSEDFVLQCMNFPQSKAALGSILKKLMSDATKLHSNMKTVLSGKKTHTSLANIDNRCCYNVDQMFPSHDVSHESDAGADANGPLQENVGPTTDDAIPEVH